MSEPIQRYSERTVSPGAANYEYITVEPDENGDWVDYDDHLAALDAADAKWVEVMRRHGKSWTQSVEYHRKCGEADGYRRGLERAAEWHDQQEGWARVVRDNRGQSMHQISAREIRALAKPAPRCPCGGDYCTNPACDWPEDKPAPSEEVE